MEKVQDNKLPFLDVLVTHTEQGFRSSVYRKPTFTGEYLNFNFHQSLYCENFISKFRKLQNLLIPPRTFMMLLDNPETQWAPDLTVVYEDTDVSIWKGVNNSDFISVFVIKEY